MLCFFIFSLPDIFSEQNSSEDSLTYAPSDMCEGILKMRSAAPEDRVNETQGHLRDTQHIYK